MPSTTPSAAHPDDADASRSGIANAEPVQRTLSRLLGLPDMHGQLPLVVALAVDSVGNGVSGPLILLFLTRVAGLGLVPAGTMLTVGSLVALAIPAVVGTVVHRFGARRVIIIAQIVQALGFGGYLFARQGWLLMICILLAACGGRAFWSSIFGVVADAADCGPRADRAKWFALSGMLQSAGLTIGGLLAGALLALHGDLPYYIALTINAASFVVSAVLLCAGARTDPRRLRTDSDGADPKRQPAGALIRHDPLYLALIVVNTAFALCRVLLGVGLPIYVIEGLHQPGWIIGPLLAVVTAIDATCQGIAVRLMRGFRPTRVIASAGALWTVWGLLTAALTGMPGTYVLPALAAAVLVFAAAQLISGPTWMALASAAAPASARAGYLSYGQYSFAIAVMVCPSGFSVLEHTHAALPWIVIAAAAAAAAISVMTLEHRLLERTHDSAT